MVLEKLAKIVCGLLIWLIGEGNPSHASIESSLFRNQLISFAFQMVQLCRRTISLIQIGANGEVQPLETG